MKYSIKGWIKDSFCDWDSRLSSVIFLPGCNFRCGFCHNWKLVENYHELEDIDWTQIKKYLYENRDFIDGLVITGGEPFIADSLLDLIKEIKQMGLSVKIDTNGSFPDKLKFLIDNSLIDGVAMDIKNEFRADIYSHTCGVEISDGMMERILRSAKILMDSDIDYEFRTTLVRTFHTPENIKNIAKQLKGAKKYVLQQYRSIGVKTSFNGGKPFSREEMENFRNMVSDFFDLCYIRYYGES